MARRQISEGRQTAYYLGTIIMVIGGLLFLSVFITGALNFGNFDNFEERGSSEFLRAIIGMVLIVIGAVVKDIGAKGFAGSGVILNPEDAREDLEPWSRMAGGVVKDAVDEAGINLSGITSHEDNSDLPFDEKLRRLHKLYEDGILSEIEYQREKAKILENS